MSELNITAILLAAGSSSRFGSDKLLARLPDQQTICGAAARNLQQAVPNTIAIIGSQQLERAKVLNDLGIAIYICEQATKGMATTLAYGIQQSADSDGWIIALADMPYIQPKTIQKVYQAMLTGASITAPFYQNKRGHPVGFSRKYSNELTALSGDRGAQVLIEKYQTELVRLDTDDAGTLKDVDEVADLDCFISLKA